MSDRVSLGAETGGRPNARAAPRTGPLRRAVVVVRATGRQAEADRLAASSSGWLAPSEEGEVGVCGALRRGISVRSSQP